MHLSSDVLRRKTLSGPREKKSNQERQLSKKGRKREERRGCSIKNLFQLGVLSFLYPADIGRKTR